jgi:hypothetical protein
VFFDVYFFGCVTDENSIANYTARNSGFNPVQLRSAVVAPSRRATAEATSAIGLKRSRGREEQSVTLLGDCVLCAP